MQTYSRVIYDSPDYAMSNFNFNSNATLHRKPKSLTPTLSPNS